MQAGQTKTDRTKNFILENSSGIFNKKGFAGTSLSDLTQATGLTKGSIYGNFENKEEVALAAFDFNYDKIRQLINPKVAHAKNFYDKLMVYVRVYDGFSGNAFPEGGCPILNTAIDSDDTHPALRQKAAAALTEWKKNIIVLLEGGIKAGEFRSDIEPGQLALSIIALIEGGIMIAKLTANQASLDKILSTVKLLLDQIKK